MKPLKLIFLLVVACLAGCSSDEETESEAPRMMIVDVTENPMDAPTANSRAAAVTTTSSLSSFSMNCLGAYKYDFTKTNNVWNTNEWPSGVNNEPIDFYAYTRGTFYYNDNDDPCVSFTVESNPTYHHDLLVAEHQNISYSDAAGHVSLRFDHACAAVRFNVYLSNTLYAQLKGSLTVTGIQLKNVNNQGNYNYNTHSWSGVSGSEAYALSNSAINVTTTPQPLSCGYLFMIPQTHLANGTDNVHLEVNYNNGESKTAVIPLNINWEAGVSYTIDIKLGTSNIK
ncbi:fimbrillin family protein [Xylanibacter brevis]|uniref:fimbrillin family protein n=1 Tax=Xylanibacter brevis TaxID=83231 RepID=UPI0009DFD8E0|nr:fimbrillin family protein [Xylanibacter brevis]